MGYLREIGPDTMVPCFSVNIKGNKDVNLVNDIVQAIFKDLSMSDDRVGAFRFPMLVTASTFEHHNHSIALKEFKTRLGVCILEQNRNFYKGSARSRNLESFGTFLRTKKNALLLLKKRYRICLSAHTSYNSAMKGTFCVVFIGRGEGKGGRGRLIEAVLIKGGASRIHLK